MTYLVKLIKKGTLKRTYQKAKATINSVGHMMIYKEDGESFLENFHHAHVESLFSNGFIVTAVTDKGEFFEIQLIYEI